MSKVFIVSAAHVSPNYQLDKVRFAVGSNTEVGLVGYHRARPEHGIPEEYYAKLPKFGCGRSHATAEKAIRDLLLANGCTGIVIEEEKPVAAVASFGQMAREFPDYNQATLPTIPVEWVDVSWHNDACPCFEVAAYPDHNVYVFVDFADLEKREIEGGPRFLVVKAMANTGETETYLETDDFAAVLDLLNKAV